MKKYIIIYSSENTKPIISRIKTFHNWVHIKNRVWCITTENEKPTEVRDRFDDVITPGDLLMVIDISTSSWAAVNIPTDAVYWLKEK